MSEKLDLRGMLCPEPVIRAKKALDNKETDAIEALVDDDICVANLERLARSLKAAVHVSEQDGFFSVSISKAADATQQNTSHSALAKKALPDINKTGLVVFFSRDQLGEGDPDFSKTLANVFLQTVLESGHQPRAILLANTGVKFLAADSPAKKVLDDFRNSGCEVLACGLCVDFYGLKQDIDKSQITNMFAICEYLTAAEKVLQF